MQIFSEKFRLFFDLCMQIYISNQKVERKVTWPRGTFRGMPRVKSTLFRANKVVFPTFSSIDRPLKYMLLSKVDFQVLTFAPIKLGALIDAFYVYFGGLGIAVLLLSAEIGVKRTVIRLWTK